MRTTKFIGRNHSSQSSDRCQEWANRKKKNDSTKKHTFDKGAFEKRTHTHLQQSSQCAATTQRTKKLGGQAAHCICDRSDVVFFFIPHGGAYTFFVYCCLAIFFSRHPRSVRISTKGPGIVLFFFSFLRQTVQRSD